MMGGGAAAIAAVGLLALLWFSRETPEAASVNAPAPAVENAADSIPGDDPDDDPGEEDIDEFDALIGTYTLVEERLVPETGELFVAFRSPDGDFAGNYHERLSVPVLPSREGVKAHLTGEVIPNDPTVTNVEILDDTCPNLEDFVCLAYRGNATATGRSVGGTYLAERFSLDAETDQHYLDTLNLYSIGRPFPEYADEADAIISAYFDLPPTEFRRGAPPPN